MSQIGSTITAGSSGVTSVTAGVGINLTGTAANPVINLDVPVTIAHGGTNATSYSTVDGTVYYDGTRLVTTATGTSGWVLTSGGAGVAPAYAAPGASGDRITGNSGGAQSPNWTLITANSTPTFVGAAGTLTLDFSLTNLILGTNGSSITTGARNTGMGFLVLPAVTSGVDNCAYGQQVLAHATTGSSCTAIGSYAMWTATTAADNNTAIGFSALYALGTGDNNTALGYNAGVSITGTDSNNILIGHNGSAGLNATTKIGTSGTHTSAYIAGIDGVDLNVAKVVTMASDRLGATTLTAGTNITITPGANIITIAAPSALTSISITGNSGGALVGSAFTFTGGTTGLTFSGAGTTETLTGTLAIANGGTNATSMATTDGTVYYDGTRLVTTATGTTGQVLTSAGAGVAPAYATLPSGSMPWAVTTVNASIVVNNGYIANKAGLLTMTLPASGAIGDLIAITGINTAVGWRIAQNANQQIFFGTSSTAVGTGGYIEATNIRDSVKLVCVVSGASTVWNVLSAVGNVTIA